jgi:hypothetical protein
VRAGLRASHAVGSAVTVLDDTAWALVFDTTMGNVSGDTLRIGSPTTKGRENAGYGGLFWRGPRSFACGVVQSPDGTARLAAEGRDLLAAVAIAVAGPAGEPGVVA